MNFFITNREIIEDGNIEHIREDGKEKAGDNLRFGQYEDGKFNLFPEPKNDEQLLYSGIKNKNAEDLSGSTRFFRQLYDLLIDDESDKNDVLFFIHGFNTDLPGVRDNFKDLEERYVKNDNSPIGHIVIFTWPGRSPDIPLHYSDDKKDAIRSGEALARGFDKVILFFKKFLVHDKNVPCDKKIHLMVHSMGHRVLKHTMSEMKKGNITIPELFTEILLIAADIEYDIFEPQNEFDSLIDFGDRIHIYFHKKDRVLDISKFTKNFSNRLGRIGRKKEDPNLKYVYDVDVTSTKDDDRSGIRAKVLNHWYYYSSTEVVNDINCVLKGNQSKFKI